ncbi:GntR family transcriptional regulator [Bradyrhizobium sp. ma5]|uniref:GntR family transcriptional regulator n=1 Tax=Bradyrhizobium sp. ma5 TaxID=3344828 RepID=UPI0035D412D9
MIELSESLPKWLQVASVLEAEIERRVDEGALRLPTEAELSQMLGVSIVTVRQALSSLEARNLVVRKRKLGTFIRAEGVRRRIRYNLGLIGDVIQEQKSEKAELLGSEIVAVPVKLKGAFRGDRNVMKFVRRRYAHGAIASLATNYTRLDVASQIDLDLLNKLPMTQIIRDHTRFKIGHVEQELLAESADPAMAASLGIEPLGPIIRIIGRTFDKNEQLLDFGDLVYRGDTYSFVQRLNVT